MSGAVLPPANYIERAQRCVIDMTNHIRGIRFQGKLLVTPDRIGEWASCMMEMIDEVSVLRTTVANQTQAVASPDETASPPASNQSA